MHSRSLFFARKSQNGFCKFGTCYINLSYSYTSVVNESPADQNGKNALTITTPQDLTNEAELPSSSSVQTKPTSTQFSYFC